MRSPVAFIIFNRPELTERVFAQIAKARPPKLLVIADGPRSDVAGEDERCNQTRAIIDRVNWDCEVLKNYSDVNLGCGWRPATGLRWVFEQVEESLVLEDDCVPHESFFVFCDELLDRYRDDARVMHISGNNCLFGQKSVADSYVFSTYTLSWGWATWRRAFCHFDPEIKLWPKLRSSAWLSDVLGDPIAIKHWTRIFDATFAAMPAVSVWDFQWLFACWAQRGLSILPSSNLVRNIGYGENATHTKNLDDPKANLEAVEITFPLRHPECVIRDRDVDQIVFDRVVCPARQKTAFPSWLRQKFVEALPVAVRASLSSFKSRIFSSANR